MRMIAAAALLAALATPAFAQSAKVTEAATALAAIQQDAAKLKLYCEMQDLYNKSAEASEKKSTDEAKTFDKQAKEKEDALGAEYAKLKAMEDEEINPESPEGKKFFEAAEAIEKACTKK